MTVISIDELEAGAVLIDDVLNNRGQLLLPASTTVNENHVRIFRSQKVLYVNVITGDKSDLDELDASLLEEAGKRAEAVFVHADRVHPLTATLFSMRTEKIARQMAQKGQDAG